MCLCVCVYTTPYGVLAATTLSLCVLTQVDVSPYKCLCTHIHLTIYMCGCIVIVLASMKTCPHRCVCELPVSVCVTECAMTMCAVCECAHEKRCACVCAHTCVQTLCAQGPGESFPSWLPSTLFLTCPSDLTADSSHFLTRGKWALVMETMTQDTEA